MLKKICICCLFFIGCNYGYAKGTVDVKNKTLAAYKAYKAHKMGKPTAGLKEKHVEYAGCAGDSSKFECAYQVKVVVHYNKGGLTGSCAYIHNDTKFKFRGFIDNNDNLVFSEYLNNGNLNYQFYGIHDESGFKGVWSKGSEKKQFVMNVISIN